MTRPRAQGILSGPPARTCSCRELLPGGSQTAIPVTGSLRPCASARCREIRSPLPSADGSAPRICRGARRISASTVVAKAGRTNPGRPPWTMPAVSPDNHREPESHAGARTRRCCTIPECRVLQIMSLRNRRSVRSGSSPTGRSRSAFLGKAASAADAGFRTRVPTPSPGLCKTIFNVLLHMDCIVAKLEVDIPYQYPSRLCSKERNNGAHQCRGACRG